MRRARPGRDRGGVQRLGRQRRRHRRRQHAVGLRPVRHCLLGATTAPASTRAAPRSTCCAPSPTSIPRASSWWRARAPASSRCKDLQGTRVSLDEPGSGTLVDARLILAAFGMTEKDLKAEYLKPQQSADKPEGRHDRRLLQRQRLAAERRRRTRRHDRHRARADRRAGSREPGQAVQLLQPPTRFPDGAYKNVAGVKTVSVNAIWATSSKQPDELIYNVTAALWNPAHASCSIPATPRAARSGSNGACRASAFRCIPVRRSSTGEGPPQVRSDAALSETSTCD